MEDFDFEKELNTLMDMQDEINAVCKEIYMDMIIFGSVTILDPFKKEERR